MQRKIKVCYQSEIHRFAQMSDTFTEFIQLISRAFQDRLPPQWVLNYYDDGDVIQMNSEKDYEEYIGLEPPDNKSCGQLYIVEDNSVKAIITAEINRDVSQNKKMEESKEKDEDEEEKVDVKTATEDQEIDKIEEKEEEKGEKEMSTLIDVEYISMKEKESIIKFTDRIKEVTEELILEDNLLRASISKKDEPSLSDVFIFDSVDSVSIISERQVKQREAMESVIRMADAFKEQLRLVGIMNQEGGLNPHYGVICSLCKTTPIYGIRYKCTECPEFNFCAQCECIQEHEHDFIKMKPRNRLDVKSQLVPSE